MRTQLDDDINHARLNARNCLILEKRDLRHGRHELNVGTAGEPRLVPTADAWQHAYALWVLAELDGDHARLNATARKCRQDADAAAGQGRPAWVAPELSLAAGLCEQAVRMVEEAGAVGDDKPAASCWPAASTRSQ